MQHWLLGTSPEGRPPASRVVALGPRQCQHLAAVVAELGVTWSVELHDDAPGDATIIILSDDLDDPFDLTLFVHGVGSSFHLDELCGDTFRRLGEHRVWADVLRAVRIRLLGMIPVSPTLH
jgi:hypothetical protein